MMTRLRSTRPASASSRTAGRAAAAAPGIVRAVLAGQGSLAASTAALRAPGPAEHRNVVQNRGESGPVRLVHLATGESIERFPGRSCESRERRRVQQTPIPGSRDKAGTEEMEQSRQQLPSRQIARGAHENDNLRITTFEAFFANMWAQ